MKWILAIACLVGAIAACDPVHDNAIDALGGETPGVRKGPLHRPGQPCILCHDGSLGSPPEFSFAGTIYVDADSLEPADGATVALATTDNSVYRTQTNAAGNFYVTPSDFAPGYPIKVAVTYNSTTVNMKALIGRDGSCAKCHVDPAGPSSAGHIYIPPNGITP